MAEYSVNRPLKRGPVHPGEILREDVLPSLELSVSEAARRGLRRWEESSGFRSGPAEGPRLSRRSSSPPDLLRDSLPAP